MCQLASSADRSVRYPNNENHHVTITMAAEIGFSHIPHTTFSNCLLWSNTNEPIFVAKSNNWHDHNNLFTVAATKSVICDTETAIVHWQVAIRLSAH